MIMIVGTTQAGLAIDPGRQRQVRWMYDKTEINSFVVWTVQPYMIHRGSVLRRKCLYSGVSNNDHPFKTQVVSSSVVMHCNSMKIILLALFSTALAQGPKHVPQVPQFEARPPPNPPGIPPHFFQAQNHNPPGMPKNVYYDPRQMPKDRTVLTKTNTDGQWMLISPHGAARERHKILGEADNMKIADGDNFQPGHTIIKKGDGLDGVLNHYEPGTVPHHVVKPHLIALANAIPAREKAGVPINARWPADTKPQ